jgi:hypothetical protein
MGIGTSFQERRPSTAAAAKEQRISTANSIVCCMGDSLTFGHGLLERDVQSYPAQLQKLLSAQIDGHRTSNRNKTRLFRVINCGLSGACATREGDLPYWNTSEYKPASLHSLPLLFFCWGPTIVNLTTGSKGPLEKTYKMLLFGYTRLFLTVKSFCVVRHPYFSGICMQRNTEPCAKSSTRWRMRA